MLRRIALGVLATRYCVSGLSDACGRVHFIGNSVSRGWAFALSARRSGHDEITDREEQKQKCGSTEGERCELPNDVAFTWAWSVWSPLVDAAMREPAQVTVINVGSHYVFSNVSDFMLVTARETEFLADAASAMGPGRAWLRTSTRACGDVYDHPQTWVNTKLRLSNRVLIRAFEARGLPVFDAWTGDESCVMFDDKVHSRALVVQQLDEWLERACQAR